MRRLGAVAGKISDRLLALDASAVTAQARGGVVVEFHGDGMLAVFGAPDELPMKELAAVQAAREIVAAMVSQDIHPSGNVRVWRLRQAARSSRLPT